MSMHSSFVPGIACWPNVRAMHCSVLIANDVEGVGASMHAPSDATSEQIQVSS